MNLAAATDGVVWGAGGAMVVISALVGLIVWFVKFVVPKLLGQNKTLIDGALENMKANTKAIVANTEATQKVAAALDKFIAVRDERDVFVKESLKRIEHKVERR